MPTIAITINSSISAKTDVLLWEMVRAGDKETYQKKRYGIDSSSKSTKTNKTKKTSIASTNGAIT